VPATGTSAALPPMEGLAEARPWTNREIAGAREVPRRLIVIGGGAVGVEMAQGFRRLGSEEVSVLEGVPRLLSREEPFASEEVQAALEAEEITCIHLRLGETGRPGAARSIRPAHGDLRHQ
jgi:pyruvate/2-oxoglutarate dehydrogenase complex dihydrolipoamide dehydrogenase (E3) component